MSASIWNPSTDTSTLPGYVTAVGTLTVSAGVTLLNLPFSYAINSNSLFLFADGQFLTSGIDYTETSSTTATLTSAFPEDVQVTALTGRILTGAATGEEPTYNAIASYEANTINRHLQAVGYSVTDAPWSAVCNGVTNDSAPIQACIDYVNSIGGGVVVIPKTAAIASTLTLASNVTVVLPSGVELKWIGATNGICVQTASTSVYKNAKLFGLTINTGAAFTGTAFYMHSAHNVYMDVLRFVTTGSSSTAFKMYADSTAGGDATTKRNITQVVIDSIVQQGQCGTLLDFDGLTSGYAGDPQVVTLNTINSIFAENCAIYGIRFRNWVDNNSFPGTCRVTINGIGGVGVQVGSATSSGVYLNAFGLLAVDTFGAVGSRTGVRIENSKLTKIASLYQHPVAEAGEFVSTAAAESYDVALFQDSTKQIINYRRSVRAASEGFNSSEVITLADDTAVSISIAGGGTDENITCILTIATDDANSSGIAWLKCRKTSGTPEITLIAGGTNFAVTTGALAGTTGVDTKLTISTHNNGRYYIENRLGFSVKFTTHISGWMQTP